MSDLNLLEGARVYLSGPMDFVESREVERRSGWRNRVAQFLEGLGAHVFDPWYKPLVKGLGVVGEEDEKSTQVRNEWTFEPGEEGARARSACAKAFWPTLHIDLRMVDLSDFVIAYCPTNTYSVGTPHEIVVARQQRKPVLFVSPPIDHTMWGDLVEAVKGNGELESLCEEVRRELPVVRNLAGIPSLWYMPLVGSENFYDGFGFAEFAQEHDWPDETTIDARERRHPPRRPLLRHLLEISRGNYPQRWDRSAEQFVPNDDWMILDLKAKHRDV